MNKKDRHTDGGLQEVPTQVKTCQTKNRRSLELPRVNSLELDKLVNNSKELDRRRCNLLHKEVHHNHLTLEVKADKVRNLQLAPQPKVELEEEEVVVPPTLEVKVGKDQVESSDPLNLSLEASKRQELISSRPGPGENPVRIGLRWTTPIRVRSTQISTDRTPSVEVPRANTIEPLD